MQHWLIDCSRLALQSLERTKTLSQLVGKQDVQCINSKSTTHQTILVVYIPSLMSKTHGKPTFLFEIPTVTKIDKNTSWHGSWKTCICILISWHMHWHVVWHFLVSHIFLHWLWQWSWHEFWHLLWQLPCDIYFSFCRTYILRYFLTWLYSIAFAHLLSPVDRWFIPFFCRVSTILLVMQDFIHPQYLLNSTRKLHQTGCGISIFIVLTCIYVCIYIHKYTYVYLHLFIQQKNTNSHLTTHQLSLSVVVSPHHVVSKFKSGHGWTSILASTTFLLDFPSYFPGFSYRVGCLLVLDVLMIGLRHVLPKNFIWRFPRIVVPPVIIHLNGIVPSKPSSYGDIPTPMFIHALGHCSSSTFIESPEPQRNTSKSMSAASREDIFRARWISRFSENEIILLRLSSTQTTLSMDEFKEQWYSNIHWEPWFASTPKYRFPVHFRFNRF